MTAYDSDTAGHEGAAYQASLMERTRGIRVAHGAGNHGCGTRHLATRDGRKQAVCLSLCTVTNNELDYRSLITAQKDLMACIQRAGKAASGYSPLLHIDPLPVVGS